MTRKSKKKEITCEHCGVNCQWCAILDCEERVDEETINKWTDAVGKIKYHKNL